MEGGGGKEGGRGCSILRVFILMCCLDSARFMFLFLSFFSFFSPLSSLGWSPRGICLFIPSKHPPTRTQIKLIMHAVHYRICKQRRKHWHQQLITQTLTYLQTNFALLLLDVSFALVGSCQLCFASDPTLVILYSVWCQKRWCHS